MNNQEIGERLVRIESRLAQLMLHMGLDPQTRKQPDGTPIMRWPELKIKQYG